MGIIYNNTGSPGSNALTASGANQNANSPEFNRDDHLPEVVIETHDNQQSQNPQYLQHPHPISPNSTGGLSSLLSGPAWASETNTSISGGAQFTNSSTVSYDSEVKTDSGKASYGLESHATSSAALPAPMSPQTTISDDHPVPYPPNAQHASAPYPGSYTQEYAENQPQTSTYRPDSTAQLPPRLRQRQFQIPQLHQVLTKCPLRMDCR
ncbi:hypothetical protein Cpir12675_005645 [Ceratocystis pirilliformis]|uniref:Uncharacterized protein n=1 Tax=Ceratocystis pirilliformis TaxID=259994 RepID=A0ABR3YN40_9PEZI